MSGIERVGFLGPNAYRPLFWDRAHRSEMGPSAKKIYKKKESAGEVRQE